MGADSDHGSAAKGSTIDLEVTGTGLLAAVFPFPPLSLPCVYFSSLSFIYVTMVHGLSPTSSSLLRELWRTNWSSETESQSRWYKLFSLSYLSAYICSVIHNWSGKMSLTTSPLTVSPQRMLAQLILYSFCHSVLPVCR